jgi:hypothetical protein
MQGLKIPERLQVRPEIWRRLLDQFGADLRVAAPGIIQSFDEDKQTVTVQLCIRERINLDGMLSWETLPLLVDVPVFMPRAGGYCITLPVTAGDECLVVFGDTCMDSWWQSGGIQNQMDKRRHDLSDGYALVGIWSQPSKLADYSTDSVQIRNDAGNTTIELKDNVVNVTAATVNVKGTSVIISEGIQGVARIGDAVAVDPNTHVGTITSGSLKVKAG